MSLTDRFMDALHHLDRTGETGPMAQLFHADATLRRMAQRHVYDRVHAFWRDYLSAFDEVRTEFHDAHAADGRVVLEWTSRGTLSNGHPFDYDGVSVLEVEGERVAAFRAYYDCAALLPPSPAAP
ncbi:MAG TPA: nuclear transport factor 2 family protein [Sandaracinaceae bacterium LLY-WYZ-13_1]|nr:nuclear transport factor 2 family protein [Sandaracinaceae bacterium LLY-WYZ-13_1]